MASWRAKETTCSSGVVAFVGEGLCRGLGGSDARLPIGAWMFSVAVCGEEGKTGPVGGKSVVGGSSMGKISSSVGSSPVSISGWIGRKFLIYM